MSRMTWIFPTTRWVRLGVFDFDSPLLVAMALLKFLLSSCASFSAVRKAVKLLRCKLLLLVFLSRESGRSEKYVKKNKYGDMGVYIWII